MTGGTAPSGVLSRVAVAGLVLAWGVVVVTCWQRPLLVETPVNAPATPAVPVGFALDINHAAAVRLQALHGVGPALAERIVGFREQHGPFAGPDDLLAVSGIGPATLRRITPWVRF